MKKKIVVLVFAMVLALNVKSKEYDVIVAGGGTGGFGAAIQAARMGCKVLLAEETDWIGGQMTAAGVSTLDEGTRNIRMHGIYREFYNKSVEYYKPKSKTVGTCYYNVQNFAVEPIVGQKILYDMIKEVNKEMKGQIDILLCSKIVEVQKIGFKVKAVKIKSVLSADKKIKEYSCKILIDATEYGDVIPLTGAKYRIGKDASGNVDYKTNVQDITWTAIVKEYENGVPIDLRIEKPPIGYEAYKKHLLYINRYAQDGYSVYSNKTSWNTVAYFRGMPNSETSGNDEYTTKTSLNIAQNDVSTTVGDCEDLTLRWKKGVESRIKTLCLIYYIQKELGLNWSVSTFDGYDTQYNRWITKRMVEDYPELKSYETVLKYFPVMPYVRESRRIVGLHTLISSEIDRIKGPINFIDAVSINDYPEDLHGSKSPNDMDLDVDPGGNTPAEAHDWGARLGPFQVPFRSFIPEEVDGFLTAEKNISQSRLVNGATRLQPSTMLNGQAVGNIAALAVKFNVEPRHIPPVLVQWEQLNAGAPLYTEIITDVIQGTEVWKSAQICLVHGLMELKWNRFFPQDPISKDELLRVINDKNMVGINIPNGVITRANAAVLFKDYLVEKALKDISNR